MTIYASLQLGYWIALAALTTCVLLKGSGPMKRTVATIFAVMLIQWAIDGWWPSVEWAAMMIAVDTLACVIITWHPAGRWQAITGLSYILQIGVHLGRIFNGDNADVISYWWGLSTLAILQLLLLGGWWLHGLGLHFGRGGSNKAVAQARNPGVD